MPRKEFVIHIFVEFFGTSRRLSGCDKRRFSFKGTQVSVAMVVEKLYDDVPELRGFIIDDDSKTLFSSYKLNINGKMFVENVEHIVKDGDSVLIIPSMAGG